MRCLIALVCLLAGPVRAEDAPGDFDYYVMSLSWSANWCALEGDARQSPQCDAGSGLGWILHGLWPQYETGYPQYCQTALPAPNRSQTAAMADIMGTPGLAWHQWNKHGTCTGLSATDYYTLSRAAFSKVTRPPVLRQVDRDITLPAALIEETFLRDNPALSADKVTITCKQGYIQEARICLTRDLAFRTCGRDVIQDCTLPNARFTPMR